MMLPQLFRTKHKKDHHKSNLLVGTGGKTNYRVLPNLRFAYAMPVVILFAGIGTYMVFGGKAASTCSPGYTINNGTNLATTLTNAPSGTVICLSAGNYPGLEWNDNYSLRPVFNKSSMTTIQAAPGVAQNQVTLSGSLGASTNITIYGVTLKGASLGDQGSAGAKHIRLINNNFTDGLCIRAAKQAALDILIDGNTFRDIPDSGGGCGNEGRITVNGDNASGPGNNGVTISNNLFSGQGGCTDGIQLTGEADGTKILNNEFTAIKQNSPRICDPDVNGAHADPIQFYGSTNTLVDGNFFHGNSTGLMAPNGGNNETITNNVFVSDGEYQDQVVAGDWTIGLISHNTFVNSDIRIGYGSASSITVTNNVVVNGISFKTQSSSCCTIDYNLSADLTTKGVNGVSGSPVFTGGANPSSWAGYQLTSNSPGHAAASDTKDMGATTFGTSGTMASTCSTLPGNANTDSVVNIQDIATVLSNYGKTVPTGTTNCADVNNDKIINIQDIAYILGRYGTSGGGTTTTCSGAQHTPGGPDETGGCWPGPGNTGPNVPETSPSITTYTGPCTITAKDITIDSQIINCKPLYVGSGATNLVIKNSYLKGGVIQNGNSALLSFTIQDSILDNAVSRPACSGPTSCPSGLYACGDLNNGTTTCGVEGSNFKIYRTEIIHTNRAAYCENTCIIEDSYFHGTNLWPDKTNLAHASSVRNEQGLTLHHNALACDYKGPFPNGDIGCSADLSGYPDFAPVKNDKIYGNLFIESVGAASFCAYGGYSRGDVNNPKPFFSDPTNATYIEFKDNIFQRGANHICGDDGGPVVDFDVTRSNNIWSNNKYDDGTLIPAPTARTW